MIIRAAIVFASLLALAGSARAEDSPSLGRVRGVVVKDLSNFDALGFVTPTHQDCTRSDVDDITFWKCAVATGSFSVTDGQSGAVTSIALSRLFYARKPLHSTGEVVRQWDYYGTWTRTVSGVPVSSEVRLTLWYYESKPADIKGFYSITAYGPSLGVQAMPD